MTKPEHKVQSILQDLGFTVETYTKSIPSTTTVYSQMPFNSYRLDFAYPYKKIAIEVHGDYWHGSRQDSLTAAQVLKQISDASKKSTLIRAGWELVEIVASDLDKEKTSENIRHILQEVFTSK